MEDTNTLEALAEKLQEKINQLSAKMPSSYHSSHTPNVTLSCNYNTANNTVEVEVTDVVDRSKKMNPDVVFAVAFVNTNGHKSMQEADLIISTESQRITSFIVGDHHIFKLKYKPDKVFFSKKSQQIIHLISNTLSYFIINQ